VAQLGEAQEAVGAFAEAADRVVQPGNRIELFGNSGILQFEPDYETVTWDLSDFDTGLAIGGATLPAETYFVYGTPGTDGQDKLLDGWKDRALV
jgi:catechol 2,3-dioxygenase